jgi:diguanylate cyclase (GGDEF)-like protein
VAFGAAAGHPVAGRGLKKGQGLQTIGSRSRERALPASASRWILVVGTIWVVANACGLLGSVEASTFLALGALAVISTVLGLRWYRPALRWPWVCILCALLLFLLGGAARQHYQVLGDLSGHRSLVPDLLTVPGYLVLAVALGGFARARRRGRSGDFDATLDAIVAALAAFSLAWTALVDPVVGRIGTPLAVKAVMACYPALSVFLVALMARIAFSPSGRRVLAYRLLFGAMGFMLLGDVVYMLVETGLVDLPLAVTDAPYAVAYVFFAAGVLHPSMRVITEPIPPGEVAPKSGRLVFVAVALGLPALLTVTRHDSTLSDRLVLAGIVLALTTTASWRVSRALRAHARSEADLAHQATHDPLTKLPNRLAAEDHLRRVLLDTRVSGTQTALLFLDLDRFKLLNDTMGHTAGDELLVAVAGRLKGRVRRHELVGRVGGDEFVVILDDVDGVPEALEVCQRIRAALEAPFVLRGGEVFSSASIGVALSEGRSSSGTAETMIREADTAMYQAKDAGRNRVSVFDRSMRDRVAERLTLEHDLRYALERDELDVHFQPIIRLPAGPVDGLEALVRWTHPTRGQIAPSKFVPIAEESSLIVEIGRWVLEHACRQLGEWRRRGEVPDDFYVSVNLSARQMRDPQLLETVRRVLSEHDLPASVLWLELTESLLMEDAETASSLLRSLRELGVQLAIDDFGTGYSSLAYVQRFPAQCVKIDRSFVDALDDDDTPQESLVAAIVAMASALGMATIAEGVETSAQEARLIQLGCTAAQGYFYSRPKPAAQVIRTVRELTGPTSGVLE